MPSRILDTFIMRASCFWLYPDFIFNRTKCGIIQKENAEYLHGFTNEVKRFHILIIIPTLN